MNPQDFNASGTSLPLNADGEQDEKMAMPIGVGEMEEGPALDPLAEARNAKKLSGGSVVIIVVVLIAVGGLFFMRRLSQVTASTSIPTEIEDTINKFLNTSGSDDGGADDFGAVNTQKSVLEVLTAAYSERQVPLKDVQRDPFVIYQPDDPVTIKETDRTVDENAILRRKQAERRAILNGLSQRLVLKSVLRGSTPLAIINGQIYRVGDRVPVGDAGYGFTVTDISTSAVTLVAEAPELGMTRAMGNAVEITIGVHDNR